MSLPVGVRGRRSIRMPEFDYAAGGVFFVTICVKDRECLFGEVVECEMRLNDMGAIVESCWRSIPEHRANVTVDAFVVMPNHLHGLLRLASVGATLVSPSFEVRSDGRSAPRGPDPGSLGAVVGCFKADVTRRTTGFGARSSRNIWQRNYYEHLVRDDRSLEQIRQYIAANPANWTIDTENPHRHRDPSRTPGRQEPWCV